MAALDFPDNPATGDLYGSTGTVWRWDGARWASTAGASGARGRVAYAYVTTNQGSITTITDIVGLLVTFNASSERTYKITLDAYGWTTVSGDTLGLSIYSGATQLQSSQVAMPVSGNVYRAHAEVVLSGLSGSYTVGGRMLRATGTGTITMAAAVSYPAFILVEDITYEAGTSGVGIEPTAWVPVTFASGWSNLGGARALSAYRKIGDNVQLRISATGAGTAASGSLMFTLPAGFVPPATVDLIGRDAAAPAIYNVNAPGDVRWYGTAANNTNCSLHGMFSVTP